MYSIINCNPKCNIDRLNAIFTDIAFPLSNNIKRKRVVSHETTLYFVAEHYNYL